MCGSKVAKVGALKVTKDSGTTGWKGEGDVDANAGRLPPRITEPAL